jgi:toxin HigB-1
MTNLVEEATCNKAMRQVLGNPTVEGRAGRRSIRVNDQFRVCFRWTGGDAEDVEIVDYH